jgi:hypothetical protein
MGKESIQLDIPGWVAVVLEEFEASAYFDESDVAGRISAAAERLAAVSDAEKKAANAECWAFQFHPQDSDEPSCWKTHFGPAMVFGDVRIPDIAWIDPAVIAYWTERMSKAKHPLLRARYADLVWDLSKASCGFKPPIDAARTAIDGYWACGRLAAADNAVPASDRLRRGLTLALSIGDQTRAEQTRDAMFELFSRINATWAWVTLFDLFEEQQKVRLTDPQRAAVAAGHEAHITEVGGKAEGAEPGPTLHVAARLVRHFRRLNRQPDADRVVLASGKAVERRAASANHTVAHFWLDHVFRFYRVNGLDAEAERVQILARERGEQAVSEMQTVSVDMEVPTEQLEAFVNGLTKGGLHDALRNIVGHFIPDLQELRARSQRLRRDFPIATMFPISKMREGQVVGNVGPVDTDPDGALVHAVSEDIGYRMFFLAKVFDRAWERYSVTPEQIVSFLYESPAFTVRFRSIIKLGIEAYFVGDHPKAIHLLVPQIENALRFLLTLIGRPANKPRRGDPSSMTEKTLADILEHEPAIKEKFGEDAHLYLVAFLADPRGRNIRNRLSHGLMAAEEFNRGISDRVLHAMLMLGTIQRAKPDLSVAPEKA